jgi:hypothetical protein
MFPAVGQMTQSAAVSVPAGGGGGVPVTLDDGTAVVDDAGNPVVLG